MALNSREIIFFLPDLSGGGPERITVDLAKSFIDRDYKVALVLTSLRGPFLELMDSSVEVLAFSGQENRLRRMQFMSSRVPKKIRELLSIFGLAIQINLRKPRVVFSAFTGHNLLAIFAKKISNSPATRLVISERNQFSVDQKGRWDSPFLRQILRRAYSYPDEILAVSHGVADDISSVLSLPRSRFSVIYNPQNIESITELSNETVDHRWFNDPSVPVILGVGRLEPQKAFEDLIAAFFNINKELKAKLVILGEGSQRAFLQNLIDELNLQNSVDLHGFAVNPFKYMARASVFVSSSKYEGLPNAVIQALICGVPIVASDCPSGPAEILENGRWGRLVPVGDPVSLAQAIESTLISKVHPDVRLRAANFDQRAIVDQYEQLLIKGGVANEF